MFFRKNEYVDYIKGRYLSPFVLKQDFVCNLKLKEQVNLLIAWIDFDEAIEFDSSDLIWNYRNAKRCNFKESATSELLIELDYSIDTINEEYFDELKDLPVKALFDKLNLEDAIKVIDQILVLCTYKEHNFYSRTILLTLFGNFNFPGIRERSEWMENEDIQLHYRSYIDDDEESDDDDDVKVDGFEVNTEYYYTKNGKTITDKHFKLLEFMWYQNFINKQIEQRLNGEPLDSDYKQQKLNFLKE